MTLAVVDEPEAIRLHPANVAECFSAINVIWLFISDPKHLTPEEQAELELICPSCEIARKSYELTQLFMACQFHQLSGVKCTKGRDRGCVDEGRGRLRCPGPFPSQNPIVGGTWPASVLVIRGPVWYTTLAWFA